MNHCHRNESHKEESAWMLLCFLEPMGIPKNREDRLFFWLSPSIQSLPCISLLKPSLSLRMCLMSHVIAVLSLVCAARQLFRLHVPSCLFEVQVQIAWF